MTDDFSTITEDQRPHAVDEPDHGPRTGHDRESRIAQVAEALNQAIAPLDEAKADYESKKRALAAAEAEAEAARRSYRTTFDEAVKKGFVTAAMLGEFGHQRPREPRKQSGPARRGAGARRTRKSESAGAAQATF